MTPPFKIIEDKIGKLRLYENYIITEINEDVVFDIEELNWLKMNIDTYYPKSIENIGYISNRINNYNIVPTNYYLSNLYNKVKTIAMVCYSDTSVQAALYEKSFQEKPFQVFRNLNDAIDWTLVNLKK
ncbi:hypothetical protein SAMN04488096_102155 [Mesonia phycicola]|uniref:SpoIIAA-like n=1 Tax=Mesonia phycicola TaxID=579105 RepID=A0A1M6BP84_9FLAO|nr:hypothetical protein [Mesonia phycicola]SHI50610.1 hypothetical protein SAMN04488096_102155 [Mesonia phycicola]